MGKLLLCYVPVCCVTVSLLQVYISINIIIMSEIRGRHGVGSTSTSESHGRPPPRDDYGEDERDPLMGGNGAAAAVAAGVGSNNALGASNRPLLPAWIWDLEDDEDLLSSRLGLMNELEIQPRIIVNIVYWQLLAPFQPLLRRIGILARDQSAQAHPITLASSYNRGTPSWGSPTNTTTTHSTHVDFMGPAIIVTAFASLLWVGNQKNVPYVYVIWIVGAVMAHLTVRGFCSGSSISFHLAVLGYSLVPLIPLCFVILVYNPSITASTLIQCACVLWSSLAAIRSYYMILHPLVEHRSRNKLLLLMPVVLLFEMYIIALVPMRRWQINHGEPVKMMSL